MGHRRTRGIRPSAITLLRRHTRHHALFQRTTALPHSIIPDLL